MFDIRDLRSHPVLTIVLCAVWAWISITLIIRMWLVHRPASFVKKFLWSLMLLVPIFGWTFYGGSFVTPSRHDVPATERCLGS